MAWSDAAREAARRARIKRRNTYPKRDGLGASSRPAIAAGIRLLRKGGLSTAERMAQFERGVAMMKRGGPSVAARRAMAARERMHPSAALVGRPGSAAPWTFNSRGAKLLQSITRKKK